jgi:uncharacterized protein YkwD
MMKLRALCVSTAVALAIGASACTPAPAPGGFGPGPTPTTPVTAPPTGGWEAEMLASVNAQRAGAGVGAVSLCGSLTRAAQAHSADQAARRTMSHTGGDGSTLRIRVERAGYLNWTGIAENVAAGYTSVPAVMNGWMNSSGHRANLLNGTYVHIGFGLASDAGGAQYWTQNFGRSGSC